MKDTDDIGSNTSNNEHFADIIHKRFGRRSALSGTLSAAALTGAPTPANPSSVSSWPFGGRPRPATLVIRKLDGGKIGS